MWRFLVLLWYQWGFARWISISWVFRFHISSSWGNLFRVWEGEIRSLEPHNPIPSTPPLPPLTHPRPAMVRSCKRGVRAEHVESSKMQLQTTFPEKQVGTMILSHCKWFLFSWHPLSSVLAGNWVSWRVYRWIRGKMEPADLPCTLMLSWACWQRSMAFPGPGR